MFRANKGVDLCVDGPSSGRAVFFLLLIGSVIGVVLSMDGGPGGGVERHYPAMAMGGAIGLAAAGIVARPLRGAMWALALGLVTGAGPSVVPGRDAPFHTGIPADRVVSVQGHLLDDVDPDNPGIAGIRLLRVCDVDGTCADATGRVLLDTARVAPAKIIAARTTVRIAAAILAGNGNDRWLAPSTRDVRVVYVPRAAALRTRILEEVQRRIRRLPPDVAGLVNALLAGRRGRLSARFAEQVRRCGCSHVLALSGMHLAILTAIIGRVCAPLVGMRCARAIVVGSALIYVWAVGPIPSLVRAAVALVLGVALTESGLRLRWPDAIALGAYTIAVLAPHLVVELAFLYSVVSLLGIALAASPLDRWIRRCVPPPIALPIAVALAAFAATSIVSMVVFGVVYPIGIAVSGPMALIVTLSMWLGIAVVALTAIPVVGTIAIRSASALYRVLERFAGACSRLGGWRWNNLGEALLAASIVVVVVAIVLWWRRREERWRRAFESQLGQRNSYRPGDARSGTQKAMGPELPR